MLFHPRLLLILIVYTAFSNSKATGFVNFICMSYGKQQQITRVKYNVPDYYIISRSKTIICYMQIYSKSKCPWQQSLSEATPVLLQHVKVYWQFDFMKQIIFRRTTQIINIAGLRCFISKSQNNIQMGMREIVNIWSPDAKSIPIPIL